MNITKFSDEQIAGQRLMIGFDGKALNTDLMYLIDTIKVGGIILFAQNLSTPAQIKNLCASVQEYAMACGQPPLLIAIDQEGGQVARLKEPFTQFRGNPHMHGEEDAESFARITSAELKSIGVNMNMAPVLDVALQGIGSVMAERAFGDNPEWVSKLGLKVIKNFQHNHIMAVAKHFPGIGRTALDSHVDRPLLDADLNTLESSDLLPFKAAIKQNVAGIMLSHILYTKIDPLWPASLSKLVAKKLLRDRMRFDGLVLTDDLDMGAIKKHYDIKTVIDQILAAEIDIALICHRGPNIKIAFEKILKALGSSPDMKTKGIKSLQRIVRLKKEYL